MKILHCLISAVVLKETVYSIKGFNTTLQAGQAIMSEVDLSNRLHYDKKTISRVLDRMNELGIVATTQSNRTSVHSLKCVSAWIDDGKMVSNPFCCSPLAEGSRASLHEMTGVRVFIIS